eukprot:1161901-Pelagomonas_calceolata.AAC.3
MRNTRPTGYLSVYTRNVHSTSASFPIPKCFFYNVHRASKKFCAEDHHGSLPLSPCLCFLNAYSHTCTPVHILSCSPYRQQCMSTWSYSLTGMPDTAQWRQVKEHHMQCLDTADCFFCHMRVWGILLRGVLGVVKKKKEKKFNTVLNWPHVLRKGSLASNFARVSLQGSRVI